jgi:hypothetical protein
VTAIDVALDGRWTDWRGLDSALDLAALTTRFGSTSGDGHVLDLPPPPPLSALRVYVDHGQVRLVQIDDPVAPAGVAATLAALGPPALRQPARLVRYGFETTDHVYPDRGLALVVAVAYDHSPEPDRRTRLVRAEVFAPSGLSTWRATWGGLGAPRPPLRPGGLRNDAN